MNMEAPQSRLFCYADEEADNPADVIHQVSDGLRAFALIFQFRESPVMGERDLTGICHLIEGFTKSLDSVADYVTETICQPRAEAARAQFVAGDAEYRRGRREAAEQLIALINSKPASLPAQAVLLAHKWRDGS